MSIIVLLARQRSGTGALNTIFQKIDGITPLGEILHPDWVGLGNLFKGSDDPSFHGWAAMRHPNLARHDELADLFIQYLDELEGRPETSILDIKLNSLNAIQPSFRSVTLQPWILDEFIRRKTPIIWLQRDNLVDCWISGLLAAANQTWHTPDVKGLEHDKVRIDIEELGYFVKSAFDEEEQLSKILSSHGPLLKLKYEELFQRDETLSESARHKLAAFLQIPFGKIPSRPSIAKQSSWSLRDKAENHEEVEKFISRARGAYSRGGAAYGSLRLTAELTEDFLSRVDARLEVLKKFDEQGTLPSSLVKDKVIVDWEAGDLAFSVAFLLSGAKKVFAIDSWMQLSRIPPSLLNLNQLKVFHGDIDEFQRLRKKLPDCADSVDLIFANTVTEHLQNLPGSFRSVSEVLGGSGHFFTNHDNYYQPVGSHDHGFLYYGPENRIVFQGIRCWEQEEKCSASEPHRKHISAKYPWTWNGALEAICKPSNCDLCPYFRRAQPWAHLMYQSDFNRLFPSAAFKTGVEGASLNKVSIFQLKQFIIEAGFQIVEERRQKTSNEIPLQLRNFSADDLSTTTIAILAKNC